MKRAYRIVGALLALCATGAPAQERKDLLQAHDRIEWDAGGLYEGRFADGTPVHIELAYPEPEGLQEDGQAIMANAYWYPRHYVGKVRALSIKEQHEGSLNLAPLLDSGALSAEQFAITLGPDKLDGKGSWSSENADKQQPFSLKRLVLYRAVTLTRPSPQAQAEGSERQFTFSALYPVLQDAGVNEWVRARAGACDTAIDCSNKVTLRWYSKTLMSLEAFIFEYNLGAAHGNYASTMRHYALGGEAPVHTRFTAFVAPSSECRDKVSTALVAKLRAQGLSWPEEGALDVLREPDFTPTPAGIVFQWNPYHVGSYAQGAPRVFLSRAELGSCVSNLPHYD